MCGTLLRWQLRPRPLVKSNNCEVSTPSKGLSTHLPLTHHLSIMRRHVMEYRFLCSGDVIMSSLCDITWYTKSSAVIPSSKVGFARTHFVILGAVVCGPN